MLTCVYDLLLSLVNFQKDSFGAGRTIFDIESYNLTSTHVLLYDGVPYSALPCDFSLISGILHNVRLHCHKLPYPVTKLWSYLMT